MTTNPILPCLFVLVVATPSTSIFGGPLELESRSLAARLLEADEQDAVDILSRLSDIGPEARGALPVLNKLLAEDQHIFDVVWAIASIGAEAIPQLQANLRTDNRHLRFWSLVILDHMGSDAALALNDIVLLLNDDDREVRKKAIETLRHAFFPSNVTVPALVQLLDGDPHTAAEACLTLARLGREASAAVPALVDCAVSHRDAYARFRAFQSLARIDTEGTSSVPVLIRALRDPAAYGFPFAARIDRLAAEELSRIGPFATAAVPIVLEKLNEEGVRKRWSFYESLTHVVTSSEAAPADAPSLLAAHLVLQQLPSEPHSNYAATYTSVCAANALLELRPDSLAAVDILLTVINDDGWAGFPRGGGKIPTRPDPRGVAAVGLGYVERRREEIAAVLTKTLEKAKDRSVLATRCAWALARVDPENRTCLSALRTALSSHPTFPEFSFYPESPRDVVEILGDRAVDVIPALIESTFTPDHEYEKRKYIIQVLDQVEPTAIPRLVDRAIQLVAVPERGKSRSHAINVLRSLDSTAVSALPDLVRHLESDNHFVRAEAVQLIGNAAQDSQVDKSEMLAAGLVRRLQDERVVVRARAASALGHFRPLSQAAVTSLRQATRDPYWSVRIAAERALGQLEITDETKGDDG